MRTLEVRHPYWEWQEREAIPIHTGLVIEDLNEVSVAPWDRVGGHGAFIDLGIRRSPNGGGWVIEIPPGKGLSPIRHAFDEAVYVLRGRGATTVWAEGGPKQMVEWQAGSLLAIPLNAWHQHFNTGPEPARFYSLNNMGQVLNTYDDEDFIFDNPFVFRKRFAGEDDYYSGEGEVFARAAEGYRRIWKTNFVPDARSLELYEWRQRGAGGLNVILEMAETVCPHISQFPVGTYKKAHRHGAGEGGGAQLLILSGVGFTLAWPPGTEDRAKLDWRANGMVVAPSAYYHQHFNTGPTPARYLACIAIGTRRNQRTQRALTDLSEEEGGVQIEYDKESPEVHRIFEEELARHGAECKMAGLSPFCTFG